MTTEEGSVNITFHWPPDIRGDTILPALLQKRKAMLNKIKRKTIWERITRRMSLVELIADIPFLVITIESSDDGEDVFGKKYQVWPLEAIKLVE